jgi:hypothetical protein
MVIPPSAYHYANEFGPYFVISIIYLRQKRNYTSFRKQSFLAYFLLVLLHIFAFFAHRFHQYSSRCLDMARISQHYFVGMTFAIYIVRYVTRRKNVTAAYEAIWKGGVLAYLPGPGGTGR